MFLLRDMGADLGLGAGIWETRDVLMGSKDAVQEVPAAWVIVLGLPQPERALPHLGHF